MTIKLGINVDHVATLRQARRERCPSPLQAALEAVKGGADGITAHLREDRRHIQDRDLFEIKERIVKPLNMEMAATPEILSVAKKVKPAWSCLVPERREELTTEGGLQLKGRISHLQKITEELQKNGTRVSLFVEPDEATIKCAKEIGADAVELHTGSYARLWQEVEGKKEKILVRELDRIRQAAHLANQEGLIVNAGHGIDYNNVGDLIEVFPFKEFNIGFAIVAQAVFVGMASAVKQMKEKIQASVCVES